MNILEFNKRFPTQKSVIKWYINIRYNGVIHCNHCGSEDVYQRENRPKIFHCSSCDQDFSIFKGTIFEDTYTDLRKWFYGIHLILNSKKGISGCQLQREIGVTYKTAWRMLSKIRKAMSIKELKKQFETIIEIDETYVGGKPRKGSGEINKRGRGTKKTPVVGIIQRGENKKVYAKVSMPNIRNQKLSAKQIFEILHKVTKTNTIVMTDEFRAYNILTRSNEYVRLVVDHTKEFVNGNIHTNNIENFWSILKRGIYGIYQHCAVKYLQSYVDEFVFRFNNRNHQKEMFDLLLKKSIL
ncbi:MAG: IS1595 family transposase [Candidatus Nanoarchaeia archaeon]|nr:IS1595 family transposase [Candidatus Nanoarchaeia archaeon]